MKKLILIIIALLAGCGGGEPNPSTPTTPVKPIPKPETLFLVTCTQQVDWAGTISYTGVYQNQKHSTTAQFTSFCPTFIEMLFV